MLEKTYRPFLNAIAYKSVARPVAIPANNLCVEKAERLTELPVVLYKNVKVKQGAPVRSVGATQPYEKVSLNFSGDILTEQDFNTNNFAGAIGNPIAEV